MATRNLTQKFVRLRQSAKSTRSPRPGRVTSDTSSDNGLLEDAEMGGGWGGISRAQLPPMWVDTVESVEEDTRQIQLKMRELSSMHTRRLMVSFDDSNDEAQDREIQTLTSNITDLFRHANRALSQIAQGAGANFSQSEERVRQNIQRSLALKLQQLSSSFRTSQKEYMARVKQQKEGGGATAGGFDFLATGEAKGAQDAGFNQMQMSVLEDTETLVRERDQEIQNIAESISELGSIFKELAVLVIDQGTILDRIDFNMEQVVEHTKEGVVQLEQAEEYQKSARPLKCILLQLLIITILVIILATKDKKK